MLGTKEYQYEIWLPLSPQGDGSTVVPVEGPRDAVQVGASARRGSYQDYVDLWVHIMDPTKLKVRIYNVIVHMCRVLNDNVFQWVSAKRTYLC